MEETGFVGRAREFGELVDALGAAAEGRGSAILVSGEPGIGKSRLVAELVRAAKGSGVRAMSGAAASDSPSPFLVFSKALGREVVGNSETVTFEQVLALDRTGAVIASRGEGHLQAGMLSAVRGFVKDSFGGELGRLEYGDYKIIVEHEENLLLAAALRGSESPEMRQRLKDAVGRMENVFGQVVEAGGAGMDAAPMARELDALAAVRFQVRRDFGGVRLLSERLKLADAILASLDGAAEGGALLLVLEDLHWADESSLFAFAHIARNLGGRKMLAVATWRPGESATMDGAVAELKGIADVMELGKFEAGDAEALVKSVCASHSFPEGFAGRLAAKCSGNPFFIVETIRQMVADGCIELRGDTYALVSEDYAVPESVDGIVERRLSSLEPDAMAMAEYASCIGREFDVPAALSLGYVRDPGTALGHLGAAGIVRVSGRGAEFAHALFQDAIYRNIDQRWKSAYHKSLGEHYERAFEGRTDECAFDLARHFGKSPEHRKALGYNLRAGEKAEAAFAMEQAATYYLTSLAMMDKLGAEAPQRAACAERLADVLEVVGRNEESLGRYSLARDAWPDPKDKARMNRKRADVLGTLGRLDDALGELDAICDTLPDGSGEAAQVALTRGNILVKKGDFANAFSEMERGLGIFEADRMEKEIADTLRAMGNVRYFSGNRREARALFERSREAMERLGSRSGVAKAVNGIGAVLYSEGKLDEAVLYFGMALDEHRKLGDKEDCAKSLNNMALALYDQGRFDESVKRHMESLEIKKSIGDRPGIIDTYSNLGMLLHQRGELAEALRYHEMAMPLAESVGDAMGLVYAHYHIGNVLRDMGRLDESEEHLSKSLALTREAGAKKEEAYDFYSMADNALARNDWPGAERLAREGIALSKEIEGPFEEAAGRMDLAAALWRMGKGGEARAEFALARKIFAEHGSVKDLAEVDVREGEMLLAAGETECGSQMVERAIATFSSIGMTLSEKRARSLLAGNPK